MDCTSRLFSFSPGRIVNIYIVILGIHWLFNYMMILMMIIMMIMVMMDEQKKYRDGNSDTDGTTR